ncbi:MAG: alpha/beta hydrolase-fold protein, partial [Bacteroidota bacterium]
EQWIVEEVPRAVREMIGQATADSPMFLAGLSMGGYGAMRLGAKYPDRFRAFSGLSSVTRLQDLSQFIDEEIDLGRVDTRERDLIDVLRDRSGRLPPFRFDCGTEDSLLDANRLLHAELEQAGIPHQYEEFPGGHEWSYWEQHLEDTLLFFQQVWRSL